MLMAILTVFGCFGNLVAAVFYSRMPQKSTTVNFIIGLCISDFLVCVLIIPNIIELMSNVNNTSVAACKISHFVGQTLISLSCLFKWLISIDRHRKVCAPFGKQFSSRSTKYSCIGIAVFAIVVAIRNLIVYDIVQVRFQSKKTNGTITGGYCTTRDDSWYVGLASAFMVADFLIILAVWISSIVTYVQIIFIVVKLNRRWRNCNHKESKAGLKHSSDVELVRECHGNQDTQYSRERHGNQDTQYSRELHGNQDTQYSRELHGNQDTQYSRERHDNQDTQYSRENLNSNNILIDNKNNIETIPKQRQHKASDTSGGSSNVTQSALNGPNELKLTLMTIVISIVFITSFVPYFIIRLLMRVFYHSGEEYELGVGEQLALKLVYLHSAFDTIIYVIFSQELRQFIKRIFCNVFSFLNSFSTLNT